MTQDSAPDPSAAASGPKAPPDRTWVSTEPIQKGSTPHSTSVYAAFIEGQLAAENAEPNSSSRLRSWSGCSRRRWDSSLAGTLPVCRRRPSSC